MRLNVNQLVIFLILVFFITIFVIEGCSTNKMVAEKPGALLWGENCGRCHNPPQPSAFSDVQWETVTMHMRVRANLEEEEIKKIVAFLQMAN